MQNGNDRLSIMVIDFNGSQQYTDPLEYNLRMLIPSFVNSVKLSKKIHCPDNTYMALIGFMKSAKCLEIFKISEMNTDNEYWEAWFRYNVFYFDNGNDDGITSALKLAKQIYDDALKGDLRAYGIRDFSPMYIPTLIDNNSYDIARIRVLIWSNGKFSRTPYVNHFASVSLNPYLKNISGVISIFCGESYQNYKSDNLYCSMIELAGVCPNHRIKGVLSLNDTSNQFDYLTNILTKVFSGCGFCSECFDKP
jgi:hypothetical protein